MKFEPKEHHQMGIDHLLKNERAALFAGMGLGKTSMTLAAIDELYRDLAIKGVLVVAPLRVVRLTWPHEAQKFDEFRWMKVVNLRAKGGLEKLRRREGHVYLINYESLPWLCDRYFRDSKVENALDVVVFDELTKAKNPNSKRIRRFRGYIDRFKYRWGLTGTPNPNSLLELFAQYRLLDDGKRLGTAFNAYRDRFFHPTDYQRYNWEPDEGSKERIHAAIADMTLVLRSKDYLGIPDTIVEDIEVPLPEKAREVYEKLENELCLMLDEEKNWELIAVNAAALTGKLLQITGGAVYFDEDASMLDAEKPVKMVQELHDAKLKALAALRKRIKEPILVACNYRHERARILREMPDAISFTDYPDEQELIQRWNAKQIPMLVADPRSIGHGLNLQQGGRVVCWYSQTYSRESYDQFNARLARTGQDEVPLIFRLVAPGTMDEAVIEALREKEEGQSSLLAALMNFRQLHDPLS